MQAFLISQLPYAYWWCFALLVLGGLNLPISEEVVVLCAGFLAFKVGVLDYTLKVLASVWLGAICGDHVSFGSGRFLGSRLMDTRLIRYLYPHERRARVERWFEQYGAWTLFFGRFLPFGIRNGVILTASVTRTRYSTFLLADTMACSLIVPTLFGLGYLFADDFLRLAHDIRQVYFGLFTFLFVILFFVWARKKWRQRSPKADANPDAQGT